MANDQGMKATAGDASGYAPPNVGAVGRIDFGALGGARTVSRGPAVYRCIAAVSQELAKVGIAKGRRNDQQGYNFRGIDEVMNTLAPVLAAQGLVILPRMLGRTVTERATKSGGVLFYVTVHAEFDFVAAEDGSVHTVTMYGEAMDSGDKATNKAMSAAYKYAAFQAFCIPLDGTPDADQTTHEIAASVPKGYDDWLVDLEVVAGEGLKNLEAAWRASDVDCKRHLTTTENKRWEALKGKAAAVDAANAKAAKPADLVPA